MRSAIITVVLLVGFGTAAMAQAGSPPAIVTFHNDSARLGWNDAEKTLSPAILRSGSFGRLWETPLDGSVPGSPLFLPHVLAGGQRRSLVFAATDTNSVYALDAASGQIVWARKRLFEPLTDAQFTGSWFGDRMHGVLSTPVIDPSSGTLFVCTVRQKRLREQFDLWALDVRTGATVPGWPVTLHGQYAGRRFTPGEVMQRGALLVSGGWVYVPFGGRGDIPPWRGWLVGVNAAHPGQPMRLFCSSPRTDGGGIWSGGGVAADRSGELFAATGNGTYDLVDGGSNLAESVLRLAARTSGLTFSGRSRDYYTPSNYRFLDDEDEDLGGATPIVLPDQGSIQFPHLLFIGGKDGVGYLLNRDHLGGVGGELWKQRLFSDPKATYHEGIRSTAAYFDAGAAGRFIILAGDQAGPGGDNGVMALRLVVDGSSGAVSLRREWTMTQPLNGPSSVSISSDGTDGGIVWVVETNDGRASNLQALDALTGAELYNSAKAGTPVAFDDGKRFTSPIVAGGRVFVGAHDLICFGISDRGQ